jgi:hypothetical protein
LLLLNAIVFLPSPSALLGLTLSSSIKWHDVNNLLAGFLSQMASEDCLSDLLAALPFSKLQSFSLSNLRSSLNQGDLANLAHAINTTSSLTSFWVCRMLFSMILFADMTDSSSLRSLDLSVVDLPEHCGTLCCQCLPSSSLERLWISSSEFQSFLPVGYSLVCPNH